ncbi:hypothetical protein F5884DRAFT_166647 [Xylogone sp. PMI_703]|nr:hypothetical protein F5884DRAFT_166647 [Xylogone sp. PMI_703]
MRAPTAVLLLAVATHLPVPSARSVASALEGWWARAASNTSDEGKRKSPASREAWRHLHPDPSSFPGPPRRKSSPGQPLGHHPQPTQLTTLRRQKPANATFRTLVERGAGPPSSHLTTAGFPQTWFHSQEHLAAGPRPACPPTSAIRCFCPVPGPPLLSPLAPVLPALRP